jgi:hypothetical protein
MLMQIKGEGGDMKHKRMAGLGLVAVLIVIAVVVASLTGGAAVTAKGGPRAPGAAQLTKPPKPTAEPLVPKAPQAPLPTKAWTIMVYIDGDNTLESYVTKDIDNELTNPGSNANVNVVAIADRGTKKDSADGGWTSTKVFYCTKGMTATPANAIADWGERNMGSPQTLIDFVTWAKTNYPASHYALVFWDHSYSWYPDYYNIRDDTSGGDSLNPDEQTAAMQAVGPVDVVAWDACQQAMVEIASNYQPYVKAMTASEDTVNWDGLRYTSVVTALQANPAMTAQQVADSMASTAQGDGMTYSSTALDVRFDNLVTAIDNWSVALKNGLPANKAAYTAAWTATQGFADVSEKDLYDAAFQLKAKVADVNIKAKCDAVMAAVTADVTVNWTNGSRKEARAHGIAIWWPKTSLDFPYNPKTVNDFAYYQANIGLAARTHWDEFLSAWVAP